MDVQVTPSHGRIEMITGCMFSGKTEELIHRATRAELADDNVIAFKPNIDDRYEEDKITTHTQVTVEATPITTDREGYEKMRETVYDSNEQIDVVVIDEANFFTEELVDVVEELASNGYRVILSGLDQTFRGEPFMPVPMLLSISDHVEKRQAVCEECGKPATKTQRLIDDKPAPYDSPTIEVGGKEKYEPRCRMCHEVPGKPSWDTMD